MVIANPLRNVLLFTVVTFTSDMTTRISADKFPDLEGQMIRVSGIVSMQGSIVRQVVRFICSPPYKEAWPSGTDRRARLSPHRHGAAAGPEAHTLGFLL
jgi:hypothetical protein